MQRDSVTPDSLLLENKQEMWWCEHGKYSPEGSTRTPGGILTSQSSTSSSHSSSGSMIEPDGASSTNLPIQAEIFSNAHIVAEELANKVRTFRQNSPTHPCSVLPLPLRLTLGRFLEVALSAGISLAVHGSAPKPPKLSAAGVLQLYLYRGVPIIRL